MDYSVLWNYIGSVWGDYNDKPAIEAFWEGLNSGIQHMYRYEVELQKSRSLDLMSPTFDIGPEFFNITYSGVDSTVVNVYPTSSGLFEFPLPEWTYSVPALTYSYVYNGVTYSGVHTQDVDYLVSGYNSLVWIGEAPSADPRYTSSIKRTNLYAENIRVLNPMLMNTWAVFCDFKIEYFADYITYGQDYYKHLKMLIWALVYKQMQAPSIKTLNDAFAISRGMPFAYASGLAVNTYVTDHYETTIGGYTYVLPAGMTPVLDGSTVSQFDVIASGIQLYDMRSNLSLVSDYSNAYNRRNTLVFDVKGSAGENYNQTFHSAYVNKLMPKQIAWYQNGPYAMNSGTLLFNSTTIFMNER